MSLLRQTKTNSKCYPRLFPLFPYQSLVPPPIKKSITKNTFFWANACLSISHTRPWLLSLCSFLQKGLCIADTEWSLTYSWICPVFVLIEEFLFPAGTLHIWCQARRSLSRNCFSNFWYIYFYFYFRMYFYTEKWLKQQIRQQHVCSMLNIYSCSCLLQ